MPKCHILSNFQTMWLRYLFWNANSWNSSIFVVIWLIKNMYERYFCSFPIWTASSTRDQLKLINSYLSPAPYLGIQTFAADNMASNSDELREFLMKEIECSVCLEVPETTPIFQCIQDHVHCSVCHPKLNHCPICRSAIKMGNRNLMAEKIHEKLLQTCCYKNCSVRKVNIKEHEAECERLVLNCTNVHNCAWLCTIVHNRAQSSTIKHNQAQSSTIS